MTLEGVSRRRNTVRRDRPSWAALSPLPVDWPAIRSIADRFGDTYLWHVEPGSVAREASILRDRMTEAGVGDAARLAHGALGLIYALQMAHLARPDRLILGVRDVRYVAPVFEGARIVAEVEEESFAVWSDQLPSGPVITGRIVDGAVPEPYNAASFADPAEAQLVSLEESIGLVSALVGLWVQESGGRVLYMGQELTLRGLVSFGDTLEAVGEIIARQPGRRIGERITAAVTVADTAGHQIAAGESIFLYIEKN